jgi:hypothetical protein
MPRLLKELPREGHSYYLDVPTRDDGLPKSRRLHSVSKYGEVYKGPRRTGRPLPLKRSKEMLQYEVWCTICMDQGCDRCPPYSEDVKSKIETSPPYTEDQNEVQL